MIGRLTGRVVDEDADGTTVLDVGGVGYELLVPSGALAKTRLLAGTDGVVTLWVHTHVREEAFTLFGFATKADRSVFRVLLGVSGIGPRIALAVLSSLSGADLAQAVQTRDPQRITIVPGVGKKTAERLILELRDKLGGVIQQPAAAAAGLRQAEKGPMMVVDALTRLGFKPAEAERAVAALGDRPDSEPLEVTIREALTVLRR